MIAHGHLPEAWAGGCFDDGDQAEVGGAAPDVADEDQFAGADLGACQTSWWVMIQQ